MSMTSDTPDVTAGTVDEMVDYITNVICQRTTPNPDTNAARLAKGIASSVINRLRKTSTLTVRADEIEAAYERGVTRSTNVWRGYRPAVDELRTKVPAA